MATDPGFLANLGGLLAGENKLSPLFNFGTGLLAASGPTAQPTSFGQRLASGMQFAGDAQSSAMRNQFIRERILAGQAERQQQEQRQKALSELTGLLGGETITPQQGDPDDLTATTTAPDPRRMMGLLAQIAPQQFAQGLLAQMGPQEATSLQRNLIAAGIDPQSEQGRKIIVDSLTKSGTTVNVGTDPLDKPLTPDQLLRFRDKDTGKPPSVGSSPRDIQAGNFALQGTEEQLASSTARDIAPVISRMETLGLGEGGILLGNEAGLVGRGVAEAKTFVERFAQTDPKFAEFMSLTDAFKAQIARLGGEKGPLTEPDVARAGALVPLPTDTPEIARDKIKNLRGFLQSKLGQTKAAPKPSQKKPAVIDFNELP